MIAPTYYPVRIQLTAKEYNRRLIIEFL